LLVSSSNPQTQEGSLIVAAKSKRVQTGKGQQPPSKKGRAASRKSAKLEARSAREGNGHEGLASSQRMDSQHMNQASEQPWEEFTRAAREQIRQAIDRGPSPQVRGWTSTAPAKQFEDMMTQLWNFGGDGGTSRYMRAMAQANVEMVGLLGRRSRAYFDLPTHLAQCRTAQQMWDEQTRFFHDMLQDYQAANDRMMSCWMEIATPAISEETQRPRKSA
jgi:hypothetical protein